MSRKKVLKPVEKFLKNKKFEDDPANFFNQLYCSGEELVNSDIIEDFINEELVGFVKVVDVTFANENQADLSERLKNILENSEHTLLNDYKEALNKSYTEKISRFFNNLLFAILSVVVPTIVQLSTIDKLEALSIIWLTPLFTVFSIWRDGNIPEFMSMDFTYRKMVIKYYFSHILNLDSKFDKEKTTNTLSSLWGLIKSLLGAVHSFLFQYKVHILFYAALYILVIVGYQNTKDFVTELTSQINPEKIVEVSTESSSSSLESSSLEMKTKEKRLLTVPAIAKGEELKFEEKPVVNFTGAVSSGAVEQSYSYTAEDDGVFRLEFMNLKADIDLYIKVKDDTGKVLESFYRDGGNVKLSAGKTYTFSVEHRGTDAEFNLILYVPKAAKDISKATTVEDQVAFKEQVNYYDFTASRDGIYSFSLSEVNEQTGLELYLFNSLDERLSESSNRVITTFLKRDEKYRFVIAHNRYKQLGKYQLNIGFPKEVKEVTNYDIIKDSLEYTGQNNIYKLVPTISGVYGFFLTENLADVKVNLLVYDQYDKLVMGNTYSNYTSGTVSLEANQEYYVKVLQKEGLTSYSLNIGHAKPIIDLSKKMAIEDELIFHGEARRYLFTPKVSKMYKITKTDNISIKIYNQYKEDVTSYYGEIELTADSPYTIVVTSSHDELGKYKLEIVESTQ